MATSSGLQAVDLTARMIREARTFSLVQALRLLGYLHAHDPEEWREFFEKNITIRSWLSLAFPACEITDINEDERKGFYTVVSTDFGLYSTLGALPTLYTEELLEEERRDESVSRDFLDILDNHLAHLRYNASLHHRLERRIVENKSQKALYMQYCLMGQADPSLRDAGLRVFLAEIFAKRARSAAQLERFLCLVLGRNDVRVEQCVETIRAIPKDQICRLGADCASLGRDAMLGMCLRDSMSRFRIHLDCVAQKDMRFFLPGQQGYAVVERHLRLFLDSPLEYELSLHPEQVPPPSCVLGTNSQIGFFFGKSQSVCPSANFLEG